MTVVRYNMRRMADLRRECKGCRDRGRNLLGLVFTRQRQFREDVASVELTSHQKKYEVDECGSLQCAWHGSFRRGCYYLWG